MEKNIYQTIKKYSDPSKAKIFQKFFKTGKGEYGEGDIFIGLSVPQSRRIAVQFRYISMQEIKELLESKIHEERLIALLILVYNYEKHLDKREEIFKFYLENTKKINNWDLVDTSAYKIIGKHIFENEKAQPNLRSYLFKFAKSLDLWERRIAIISTLYFIKNNRFDETLDITKILMNDKHDLIHKACGWMLREVGKKDKKALVDFLKENYKQMPRTMLRYSIEKFPEKERKAYLKGTIK